MRLPSFALCWAAALSLSAALKVAAGPDAPPQPSPFDSFRSTILYRRPTNPRTRLYAANSLRQTWPLQPRPIAHRKGDRYRSNDWLTNFLSLPRSRVAWRIAYHLISNVLLSIAIVYVKQRGVALPSHPLAHTASAGFLSLLLVFRTNAAYARFWEARCLWGKMVGALRSLCLGVGAAARAKAVSESDASRLFQDLAAFPLALAHKMARPGEPHPQRVAVALSGGVACRATAALPTTNGPLALLADMEHILTAALVHPDGSAPPSLFGVKLLLDDLCHELHALHDVLGGCDRILRTPVPLSYSRHTSRFLTMWTATLPCVLAEQLGWWTVLACAFVSWAVFGIEEIGHLIEQPFRKKHESPPMYTPPSSTEEEGGPQAQPPSTAPGGFSTGLQIETLAEAAAAEVDALASV